MPSIISVNFTTQAEVEGSNPPDNKSVNASVLRSVLNAGLITGGYVTLAGTETITGTKTFTNTIVGSTSSFTNAVIANNGAGYAALQAGASGNPGYLAWFTPDNTRRGYVGSQVGADNIGFVLEAGWGLNIVSPSKPVLITGDLTVTGNTTGIIPVGAVMGFFTNTAPAGWLRLNGAATLSRTLYPNLWQHARFSGNIVTKAAWDAGQYGSFHYGDGNDTTGTTFGIPFTEGFFLRGFSFGNGWDAGRVIGSYQADGLANHTHSGCTGTESADHTHHVHPEARQLEFNNASGPGNNGRGGFSGGQNLVGARDTSGRLQGHFHCFSTTNPLANATPDTRPKNVPILYCIKF